jgi:hypothetical protein
MARAIRYEDTKLYRTVMRYPDGNVAGVYGPYTTKAAAARMVTTHATSWRGLRDGLTGTVEATEAQWAPWSADAPAVPETPLHEFTPWPKTARLFRDIVVTEKLDGTNAAIVIRPLTPTQYCPQVARYATDADGNFYAVFAQSRKRIITPGKSTDNYGFAAWVWDNATELVSLLGPGMHFGEWWGSGINRAYGYANGDRRFSLFNAHKWGDLAQCVGGIPLDAVPVLYQGPMSTEIIAQRLAHLRDHGSVAAPGFANPEGVCVYHSATRQTLKVTLDNNDAGKWETL